MGRLFDIVLIFAATVTGIHANYATDSATVLTWLFAIVVAGLACRLVAELLGRIERQLSSSLCR